MSSEQSKKCSRCDQIKPLSEFKNWNTPAGKKYRSECKSCNKEYDKNYNSRYYKAVTVEKRNERKNK